MSIASCDIYADEVLFKHIEGSLNGCDILLNPRLVDGIYIACDESSKQHHIIYPSTIDDTDIKSISNALNDGKKIKSVLHGVDNYVGILEINSIVNSAFHHDIVDNVLITTYVFSMRNTL